MARDKELNNFRDRLIKSESELVLDNIVNDTERVVFRYYFEQKMCKTEIQNKLKMSKRKFNSVFESLCSKIYRIPELGLKYNAYYMPKSEIIYRCNKMGKSEDYLQYCLLAYYKRLQDKQICDIMCIEFETCLKYKYSRRKELEQFKE